MKNTKENKEKVIQYLYGDLDESSIENFEEQLFTDENLSLFVDDVEHDLIDEYVRGELEFEQKREFESKYLTTESRFDRVALARTMHNELFATNEETVVSTQQKAGIWHTLAGLVRVPNLALAGGVATLLLLVLLGGFWLLSQPNGNRDIAGGNENRQENIPPIQENLPPEVSPKPAESPKETPEENTDKVDDGIENKVDVNKQLKPNPQKEERKQPKEKPTPKTLEKKPKEQKKPQTVVRKSTIFVASLLPPLRNNQTPVLKIPVSSKTVRLQLFGNFGQKYEKFVIEVNSGNGISIWGQEIKVSNNSLKKSLTISVPNNKFKSGNYEIAISGVTGDGNVEEINFYNFVVQKEEEKKE